ncbi:hypothetical protein ACIBQX_44190 [Nonomuraea sp. NPDC049714]|uniref:hypothetical protein n=1 Tax=Nonomuraea sp. NPDC049714 TaxID=3364357 RepID=UPI00379D324A
MVEVCQGCSWNRLTASFVLGNGRDQLPAFSRRDTAVTEDGEESHPRTAVLFRRRCEDV